MSQANPFEPPAAASREGAPSRLGRAIAGLGIIIAVVPTGLMLYKLAIIYADLSAKPSTSCRPVPIYGIGLSMIGFVIVVLFATMARLLGTKQDAELALCGIALIPLPFGLDFFGTLIVIWLTGSSLGS